METLFSDALVRSCIASESEIAEVKANGKKFVIEGVDGTVTAYEYQGKTYVVDIRIIPE